jgi:hypothetical protein
MKRHVPVAALALAALAPLVAQTPQGWKMRVDHSTAAADPDAPGAIKFVTMGSGFHATILKLRCTGIQRIPWLALILSRARLHW